MPSPKIVLTADRTLMSLYRGLSLATFFGCAPALDPNRDKSSIWYKILGNQVTPKVLFDFICNYAPPPGVSKTLKCTISSNFQNLAQNARF